MNINFLKPNFEKLNISQLKKVADFWQRKYLLKISDRDSFNRILCPITMKWLSEDNLHVCHIVDRAKMITRYDLDNVFLGSAYSNKFEASEMVEGYKSLHHKRIQEYFGKEYVDKLHTKSEEIILRDKDDYIEIIKRYMDGE